MQVEVYVVLGGLGVLVDIVLGEYLPVAIYIYVFFKELFQFLKVLLYVAKIAITQFPLQIINRFIFLLQLFCRIIRKCRILYTEQIVAHQKAQRD